MCWVLTQGHSIVAAPQQSERDLTRTTLLTQFQKDIYHKGHFTGVQQHLQYGDEELPKAKKMKKETASAKAVGAVGVSQRIDFAAAQRAVEEARLATQGTASVKKEDYSKSKEPPAHAEPPAFGGAMSETVNDEEDYFQAVTEELEEDSFFELDDGTLQLLVQSGQSNTKLGDPSIILALESLMAADPTYAKFFKGAKKLHAATPPEGLPYISAKVINLPKNKWNREPNEAIYLNIVLLSQPLLSKKGAVALTIYHMKNPNGMQPQPTFKWCILSYKVVFDTTEHAQAAYAAVSAEQNAKSGLPPVKSIMRDHNNEVVKHEYSKAGLNFTYRYPILKLTFHEGNAPPSTTYYPYYDTLTNT